MQYLAIYCFRVLNVCVLAFVVMFGFTAIRAQELPPESFTIIETSPNDLGPSDLGKTTKIRKLGKLVSIEGDSGTPGSFREWNLPSDSPEEAIADSGIFHPDLDRELILPRLACFTNEPYSDYRSDENWITYMPGDGDQFGWLSFESLPYKGKGYGSGIVAGLGIHLLSGPEAVALPPRVYDFSIGYQLRGRCADVLSYDLASTIGVFSDFEDSARDGVRFPGHAVGMLHYTPEFDLVFGVDYVSRDDIKILPVAGFSWRPRYRNDLRFDLVFPRPRIEYSFNPQQKMYLAGRLGGGTWDIEFPNNANDVVTYRDFQLLFGLERKSGKLESKAWEFGYVFDRQVSFRELNGETKFDDAFVFRMVTQR